MYEGENEPTNTVLGQTETTNTATKITRGAATRSGDTARTLIRRAKQASRRRFPSEEKIRILLEGMRGEVSVAALCRREGLQPTVYYKWLKDFMEAGKKRLRGDTQREATGEEVGQLRQENERLKQLVADLSLANMTLKKACTRASGKKAVRPHDGGIDPRCGPAGGRVDGHEGRAGERSFPITDR